MYLAISYHGPCKDLLDRLKVPDETEVDPFESISEEDIQLEDIESLAIDSDQDDDGDLIID